jgi:hypothetical protein
MSILVYKGHGAKAFFMHARICGLQQNGSLSKNVLATVPRPRIMLLLKELIFENNVAPKRN